MPEHVVAALSAWIIEDGNYGDFSRGERASFALEFSLCGEGMGVDPGPDRAPALDHAGAARYRARARVAHVAQDWWVIDAGILLYRRQPPPDWVRPDDWVTGDLTIGVDPFPYFETLALRADAPALIYDWTIEKIEIQTTPLETRPGSLDRDTERLVWREITATDAWHDEPRPADYLLHCRRLDSPARRTLSG